MYFPEKIEIETVRGICTATCPMCSIEETRYNKIVMNMDKFKLLVDNFGENIKKIKRFNLVGLGETLADKKLDLKIKYLKDKGASYVAFPSNGSLLKEEMSEKILMAGLDEIIMGIDSLKKEKFEKIRRDLIFEEIIENTLSHINVRNKGNYDSKIMVRMILSNDNLNEWEEYINYWSKYLDYSKGDAVLYFKEHNWSEHDYPNSDGAPKTIEKSCKCTYVYDRLCIDAHGNVKLCCVDINANFFNLGNVFFQDPIEIFNNKQFQNFRKLMDRGEINKIKPCKSCDVPLHREDRGYFNDNNPTSFV